MCMLRHNPIHKEDVGGRIWCRLGSLFNYRNAYPQWRSIGSMGTEGSEGATPNDDVPESRGWTLEDATLRHAAVQVHLT